MHISACSSCHRAIIWTLSPAGAMLPLDARPVTIYGITEVEDPPLAFKIGNGVPVHVSHFLTCPGASQHSAAAAQRHNLPERHHF